MAGIGSILVDEVVPTVATTAIGVTPTARSFVIACSRWSGRIRNTSSVSICLVHRRPIPSAIAALSIELCAWVEVYSASGGRSSRPAMPCSRMSRPAASRAAARAYKEEAEAVSAISPNQLVGRPSISATHCRVRCSNSVAAGEVRHSMALTLSAAAISSPTIPGPEPLIPK